MKYFKVCAIALLGVSLNAAADTLPKQLVSNTDKYTVQRKVCDADTFIRQYGASLFGLKLNSDNSWEASSLDGPSLQTIDWENETIEIISIKGDDKKVICLVTPPDKIYANGADICPYNYHTSTYIQSFSYSRIKAGYSICTSNLTLRKNKDFLGIDKDIIPDEEKIIDIANKSGILRVYENSLDKVNKVVDHLLENKANHQKLQEASSQANRLAAQPQVKTIGQTICKTNEGTESRVLASSRGQPIYADPERRIYKITGVTEQVADNRIAVRIGSIVAEVGGRTVYYPKLDGTPVYQTSQIIWDAAINWVPCQ